MINIDSVLKFIVYSSLLILPLGLYLIAKIMCFRLNLTRKSTGKRVELRRFDIYIALLIGAMCFIDVALLTIAGAFKL